MGIWNRLTLAATAGVILLSMAVIGLAIYVVVGVRWPLYSVFVPLTSVPLILAGILRREKLFAAWMGVLSLILSGAIFLFSVGLPFLVTGILIALLLTLITLFGGGEADTAGFEGNQDVVALLKALLPQAATTLAILLAAGVGLYVYYFVPDFGALPLLALALFIAGLLRRDWLVAWAGVVLLAAFGMVSVSAVRSLLLLAAGCFTVLLVIVVRS